MYQIESSSVVFKLRKRLFDLNHRSIVSRAVLFLGLTSFFTDISSEMVSTIFPLYLLFSLHLAPLEFGMLDGVYRGAAALVRVASGLTADRWRRHKEVAGAGYTLSALCKLGLLAVGSSWIGLAGVVLLDRTGKGIRTAPRDALISLNSPEEELGVAFGIHRALDTAGAMLGPLIAFGLLALVPGAFDTVFVVSFCFAMLGLAILTFFVENLPARVSSATQKQSASLRSVIGLLRIPRFRMIAVIGLVLSLATVSDGFLYLSLQKRMQFNLGFFPLLYVVTALVYMMLAVPVGRLADRIGRGRVFIGGYVMLMLVYVLMLLPIGGLATICLSLVLFGAYYAATDGVLMAIVSIVLPEELRTSGLALIATAVSLAQFGASILFGMLWTWWNVETALQVFLAALVATTIVAAVELARTSRRSIDA